VLISVGDNTTSSMDRRESSAHRVEKEHRVGDTNGWLCGGVYCDVGREILKNRQLHISTEEWVVHQYVHEDVGTLSTPAYHFTRPVTMGISRKYRGTGTASTQAKT
jgi:hypothetical protein